MIHSKDILIHFHFISIFNYFRLLKHLLFGLVPAGQILLFLITKVFKRIKSKQKRPPALPSIKKCYQGSVGYRQQTTSALDALLNRSHSHNSARCFDGPTLFWIVGNDHIRCIVIDTQSICYYNFLRAGPSKLAAE